MTEAEWLASADPTPMIRFVEGTAGDRKRRLYAVACCCHVRQHGLLAEPLYQEALLTAERFADGTATVRELKAARDTIEGAHPGRFEPTTRGYAAWALRQALATRNHVAGFWASEACCNALTARARGDREWNQEVHEAMTAAATDTRRSLAALVRCVHGNPFQPVTADPGWRTSSALALSTRMYEARDFTPMPVLADALQEAGCDAAAVLDHCRSGGPHVRGCWVVDLLLGKKG
jgi:hypothetical protein